MYRERKDARKGRERLRALRPLMAFALKAQWIGGKSEIA